MQKLLEWQIICYNMPTKASIPVRYRCPQSMAWKLHTALGYLSCSSQQPHSRAWTLSVPAFLNLFTLEEYNINVTIYKSFLGFREPVKQIHWGPVGKMSLSLVSWKNDPLAVLSRWLKRSLVSCHWLPPVALAWNLEGIIKWKVGQPQLKESLATF